MYQIVLCPAWCPYFWKRFPLLESRNRICKITTFLWNIVSSVPFVQWSQQFCLKHFTTFSTTDLGRESWLFHIIFTLIIFERNPWPTPIFSALHSSSCKSLLAPEMIGIDFVLKVWGLFCSYHWYEQITSRKNLNLPKCPTCICASNVNFLFGEISRNSKVLFYCM